MDCTIAGTTGENELSCEANLVKAAGRADSIRQRLRRTAIRIGSSAEHYYDIGGPPVISFAKAKHLK